MPTLHPPASYDFCFRRVVKFAGWADANYPEGDHVMATAPATDQIVKSQICQSDVEICALMASVEGDPYRSAFFTETPSTLTSGDRIPRYIGVHGGVEVLVGTVWKKGKLAQSFEHLQRVQDKSRIDPFMIPDSSKQLYWIDNQELHLASTNGHGRVAVPTIPIADDTASPPTLSTPKARQNAVIAHALLTLNPVGADRQHRTDWGGIFAGYVQMIMAGNPSLPDPEAMQRIAS